LPTGAVEKPVDLAVDKTVNNVMLGGGKTGRDQQRTVLEMAAFSRLN
jgi:hypothetical protein